MRTLSLLAGLCGLGCLVNAQTVVFADDFESGQLDGEWFHTGNDPVMVAGFNSQFAVSKETNDLCSPPLEAPWNLSLLFHPVDFDSTAIYTLSAAIRVDAPFNNAATGEIGLGWLATTGGYGFYYGNAQSSATTWESVYLAPTDIGPAFPGSRFGIVLHLAPTASGAHAAFDNIKLMASWPKDTGVDELGSTDIRTGPNPMVEALNVTFAADDAQRTVELFDLNGRSVIPVQRAPGMQMRVDVAGLSVGCYVLRIVEGERVVMRRVVKG